MNVMSLWGVVLLLSKANLSSEGFIKIKTHGLIIFELFVCICSLVAHSVESTCKQITNSNFGDVLKNCTDDTC